MPDTNDRPPENVESLRAEIARLNKVVQALVSRAERNMSERSDFGLFQTTILLEDRVRERTRELEAALRENEKITRDLQRAKQQMEREIEERKRAHAALEREREAQRVLIRQLEQAMNQLVQTEKLASLGSLVAGVAHELNTPLGNSLTVASTLREQVQEFGRQVETGDALRRTALLDFIAHCRDAAALVEKNSHRAADLIGNFKQVAVDQTSMRRRSFDLRQALDEVLSTLQPKLKHTQHRLEVAVERGIVLDSFPGPLEQIVTNLVTNSLLHGFEGIEAGLIRIEGAPTGDERVALSYADDGVGIPETLGKRVFDPFFTTKLGGGGSGLGLYIVFNLVTAVLGGTITLSSSPGQGARFDMLLPRVAPQTATTGEESCAT